MQIKKIVVLIINVYKYTYGNLNFRFFLLFVLSRKRETTKQKGYQLLPHLSEILTCNLQLATYNLQFTPSGYFVV